MQVFARWSVGSVGPRWIGDAAFTVLLVVGISSSAMPRPAAATVGVGPPGASAAASSNRIGNEAISIDARDALDWVIASQDNHALPFVIIDKVNARVFVFDAAGTLLGAAPALLGMTRGDESVPDIGQRKLAMITPAERTTPAGRFEASLGHDFEQDILWIDYAAALSMHRVVVGRPTDHRAARLASPSAADNRISYGCVNVPAKFYDEVVKNAFSGTVGIVYILPETKPLRSVFAVPR